MTTHRPVFDHGVGAVAMTDVSVARVAERSVLGQQWAARLLKLMSVGRGSVNCFVSTGRHDALRVEFECV